VLRAADGSILLKSLPGPSKIMVQNDILHARKALKEPGHLVPHQTASGARFAVVKDQDGTVLAKSRRVAGATELEALMANILQAATAPAVVDLSKHGQTV
jgi:hypothetical protein